MVEIPTEVLDYVALLISRDFENFDPMANGKLG
jgi:hypothetical protein